MSGRAVRNGRRAGFTLIELLVVMFIIMILAGLTVAFLPSVMDSRRAAAGADQLQGWLLLARQRALRDRTPTGVRLLVDANGRVQELVFIQQPEDLYGGRVGLAEGTSGTFAADPVYGSVDFTGGFGDPSLQPVQVGDYIEFRGGGLVRRITSVGSNHLTWESPLPFPVSNTPEYRVIRSPRMLAGEPPLRLPRDVAVEAIYCKPVLNQTFDILFAPSGEVLSDSGGESRIILFIHDTSIPNPNVGGVPLEGAPSLLAIEVRTGLIGAHPVNINGTGDALYDFARDARSSGM
jgi:prepilin-type N-terminal cleavage/methylation domain-containing protein